MFQRFSILCALCFMTFQLAHGHVALDNPGGGETFYYGQTVVIQWHIVIEHDTENWDLYFSSDGGENWEPIELDIPFEQLTYSWTVPELPTTEGVVRIVQDNLLDMDYEHQSTDFTIQDPPMPPVISTQAEDLVLECDMSSQEQAIQEWLNDHGGASATTFCDEVNWANNYAGILPACGATGGVDVIFQVTDDCGSSTTVATLTIEDNTPPDITQQPMDMTVECDGVFNPDDLNAWLFDFGGGNASDACGSVLWSHEYTTTPGCGGTSQTLAIFTITDECGNTSTASAEYRVVDTSPPQFTKLPADMTYECDGAFPDAAFQEWLDSHAGAEVSDACSELTWGHEMSDESLCGSTSRTTVTFTVSDACGNTATANAKFEVVDNVPPVFDSAPVDATFECDGNGNEDDFDLWVSMGGGGVATDGCGVVLWNNSFNKADLCGKTLHKEVTFVVTDECGNEATAVAQFTVEDTEPPEILVEAADTTIECGLSNWEEVAQSWLDRAGGAIAEDDCSEVLWQEISFIGDPCGPGTNTETIIFTVTDDCGNSSTTSAVLILLGSTSINDPLKEEFGLALAPNPAAAAFRLVWDRAVDDPVDLVMTDAVGAIVMRRKAISAYDQIQTSRLEPGVYFVEVRVNDLVSIQKLLIQH